MEIFTDLGISCGFSVGGFEFAARKNPFFEVRIGRIKGSVFGVGRLLVSASQARYTIAAAAKQIVSTLLYH